MKKNSEYVGVDEKFVPENERYVKDSILGSREETKNKLKKGLKIGLGAYAIWVLLGIVFFIVVVVLIFNHSKKMNQQIFDMFGSATEQMGDMYNSATEQMNNQTQNKEDTADKMNEMQDVMNSMGSMMDDFMNNQSSSINKTSFNATLEMYSGTEYGSSVGNLLDKVVTSNKTNKDHIITVTYKETTTTSEDEIVNIKHSLDKFTEYEVSLDYDANGYINKVTVNDI